MSDLKATSEKKDYLAVDDPIPGQNYVCMSFVSPEKLIQDFKGFQLCKFLQAYCKEQGLKYDEVYSKYEDYIYKYSEELERDFDEKNEYKSEAYDKAAYIIDRLPFKVTNGEELKKMKGIGKSIAKIVDEFLSTGKVKKLEELEKGASTNEEIAIALENLSDETDDPFKVRAFKNAAKSIRKLDFEVTNGQELCTGPNKVKGIGKSIANKIDMFLQTGEM